MNDTTALAGLSPVATSPARAGLQERVRRLARPSAETREHVGGRPSRLAWSGVSAR